MNIKHNIIFIFIFLSWQYPLLGQESNFTVEVNRDTVLLGNSVHIKFTLENYDGEFTPPSFDEFNLIGGPNVSTSMSIINGDMSKMESYTYILQPREVGECTIDTATLSIEDIETEPITIIVLDNPEGIIQDSKGYKGIGQFILPNSQSNTKKKYKRRKI